MTATTFDEQRAPRDLGRILETAGVYAALSLLALQTIYPLLWVLFGSLKTKGGMMNNIWGPPRSLELSNYSDAWRIAGMGDRILNSLTVTALALVVLIIVAPPCA